MFGCLVVNFVDLDDLVNDMWLDDILRDGSATSLQPNSKQGTLTSVHHRHDDLADVMMDVLAGLNRHSLMRLLAFYMLNV